MCVQNTARDIQIRGDGPRQGLSAIVAYRRSANRCCRSGQQSARLGSYHLWADLCQGKYARWRQSRLDQSQVCQCKVLQNQNQKKKRKFKKQNHYKAINHFAQFTFKKRKATFTFFVTFFQVFISVIISFMFQFLVSFRSCHKYFMFCVFSECCLSY